MVTPARSERVASLLSRLCAWAEEKEDVAAVALCGSYARENPGMDSDVDLVILLDDPKPYLADISWALAFGVSMSFELEDWNLVQSVRVFYEDGLEVEFGLTVRDWALPAPGTMETVADAFVVLYDPDGLLTKLVRLAEGKR